MDRRLTIRDLQEMKRRGEKIAALTAYDYLFARLVDESGVDLILVGDSLGQVVCGHDSTLAVTLDDGVVFSAPERFSAEDERVVYEHAVAPGQHVLGLDVERYDARRREYRSWQASKFSLLVPDGQTVEAHFVLEDDSEMGVDFPEDQDGEYELGVRLRARVVP